MVVRFVGILIVLLLSKMLAQAQERCGTVPYMQNLFEKKNIKQDTEQFERWLQTKISQRKLRLQAQRQQGAPYKIPVVVHVIFSDLSPGVPEPIGVGTNISDAQILSQIEVLNKDFQRANTDAVLTPGDFLPVAAGFDIEFVLAKQTPEGLPTTGIVRVNGGRSSWAPFDEELNAVSYWPAQDYLNIWVTRLGNSFLGYAQFPYSNSIPGLIGQSDDIAETDGVVIDFQVFGVGASNPDYNLGRTTTHEVGHFFGLRHIWGDSPDCIIDDYVSDTPVQENETYGCELHPSGDACSSIKMFQNYMDYTDDLCMNLFTQGQVDRMIAILEDTDIPRRNSLFTSHGLEDPVCGTDPPVDIQITYITQPGPVTCNDTPVLAISIKNLSCPIITSAKVEYRVNEGSLQSTTLTGLNVLPTAETLLSVGTVNLAEGENSIEVRIALVNGEADDNAANSDTVITIIHSTNSDFIPLRETFDNNSLNSWPVANPQDGILWNLEEINNQYSARFPTPTGLSGEKSWLVSPVLSFSNTIEASLFFDVSYQWDGVSNDRLQILASTDCGDTYFIPTPEFDLQGNALNSNGNQKYLSLTSLAGFTDVRIAFVATSEQGNNIYVDNIEFFVSDDPFPIDPENKPFAIYWGSDGGAMITFNLSERQDVGYFLCDMMGRQISNALLPDMLNQTIPISGINSPGIYIVRLQIGNKFYPTKVYLSP